MNSVSGAFDGVTTVLFMCEELTFGHMTFAYILKSISEFHLLLKNETLLKITVIAL